MVLNSFIALVMLAMQPAEPLASHQSTMGNGPHSDRSRAGCQYPDGTLLSAVQAEAMQRRTLDGDPQADAEIKRVEAVAHGLMAADNARDVERVVELYAPDAILMPPNESPVEGIAAIRPRYRQFFRTHDPALAFTIAETVVVDDLAYVRGRTHGTIRGREGITDRSIDDVFLMILKRADKGVWKISRLMWHAAALGG
jgi:uncharacterized protein (TIGR02246 family)